MRLVLAKLLWAFDLEWKGEAWDWECQKTYALFPLRDKRALRLSGQEEGRGVGKEEGGGTLGGTLGWGDGAIETNERMGNHRSEETCGEWQAGRWGHSSTGVRNQFMPGRYMFEAYKVYTTHSPGVCRTQVLRLPCRAFTSAYNSVCQIP